MTLVPEMAEYVVGEIVGLFSGSSLLETIKRAGVLGSIGMLCEQAQAPLPICAAEHLPDPIYVVACLAHAFEHDVRRSFEEGVSGQISKPVVTAELEELLERPFFSQIKDL